METHELEYMYDAGGTYHFMNSSNYDQIEMDEDYDRDYFIPREDVVPLDD